MQDFYLAPRWWGSSRDALNRISCLAVRPVSDAFSPRARGRYRERRRETGNFPVGPCSGILGEEDENIRLIVLALNWTGEHL